MWIEYKITSQKEYDKLVIDIDVNFSGIPGFNDEVVTVALKGFPKDTTAKSLYLPQLEEDARERAFMVLDAALTQRPGAFDK